MKHRDIDNSTKITDLERMFNVYEDDRGFYRYNLNETIYLNVDITKLKYFVLKTDSYWTLVSHQLYKTTRVAWLLMKLNEVDGKHIFDKLRAGQAIKYLDKEDVNDILGVL